MPTQIWSFVGVAALIIIIPGADMALVANNTIRRGRAAGFRTVAGAGLGLGVHASAAVAGLSAVIATSATAFSVVKVAGAIFLIWLGLATLWATYSPSIKPELHTEPRDTAARGEEPGSPLERGPSTGRDPFLQGFLTNVLNPKLAVFFLSFLPQFVSSNASATPQIVILSAVFISMGAAWLSVYVVAVDSMSDVLQRPAVEAWTGRVVGVSLAGLGLRLALISSD